jgi:hypothetical protein
VLADFPNIGEPKTTSANKALFQFLSAKSDLDYREMLMMLRCESHRENGVEALRFLLTFCAAQDQDERHRTHHEFVNARINDAEHLQSFNRCFNNYLKHTHLSGIAISDEERLDQYFLALIPIQHVSLRVKLESFTSQRERQVLAHQSTILRITQFNTLCSVSRNNSNQTFLACHLFGGLPLFPTLVLIPTLLPALLPAHPCQLHIAHLRHPCIDPLPGPMFPTRALPPLKISAPLFDPKVDPSTVPAMIVAKQVTA